MVLELLEQVLIGKFISNIGVGGGPARVIPTRPGPQAGRGREADRTTVGSAVGRLRSGEQPADESIGGGGSS